MVNNEFLKLWFIRCKILNFFCCVRFCDLFFWAAIVCVRLIWLTLRFVAPLLPLQGRYSGDCNANLIKLEVRFVIFKLLLSHASRKRLSGKTVADEIKFIKVKISILIMLSDGCCCLQYYCVWWWLIKVEIKNCLFIDTLSPSNISFETNPF